jgi:hypothetical protein
MRRPNMLRCNKWINDCLEVVASNPRASQVDKYLVSWIRLTKIAEEIGSSLGFDDPSNMADIAEPSVQLKIAGFERSLEAWKKACDADMNGTVLPNSRKFQFSQLTNTDAITLQYHYTQLHLHEIAMHDDHPVQDFMPPFGLEKILSIQPYPRATSSYIDSTAISISSAQAFLDILLNMDIDTLRMIPIFNYVRMAYALITLVKLYISSKSPTSPIGAVLDSKSLKVGYYISALMETLIEATGPNECRAPYTFLGMVLRLQGWHTSQEHTEVFTPPVVSRSADDCWLPPVPDVSQLEKQQASLRLQPTGQMPSDRAVQYEPLRRHMEKISLNSKAPNVGIPAQAPVLPLVDGFQEANGGGEQGIDDFMLYDTVDPFEPDFSNWIPDLDMGALDGNQMPDAFDWELQGTGHTPI